MRRLPLVASRSAVHEPLAPRPSAFGATGIPLLTDGRGRRYTYLRLSITDRCDLACVYCMPPGGEDDHGLRAELLSFEEIVRVVGVFSDMGIRRVRLTGGEPLVRKDAVRLVAMIAALDSVDDVVLTSNATRLAELAQPLADAGLSGVNISIDTLDAERFRTITRGGDLGPVLAGIRAAVEAGLEVKLNTVPMRGINDDEVGAIVDYAWDLGVTPRFIELMPLGEGAALYPDKLVTMDEVRQTLGDRLESGASSHVQDRGPARYVRARTRDHGVGFIAATSGNFCDTCNRVRLTARGDIRACLAHRRAISLRDVMRTTTDDREVAWAIHQAIAVKDEGHHFLESSIDEHEHVGMSLIGG